MGLFNRRQQSTQRREKGFACNPICKLKQPSKIPRSRVTSRRGRSFQWLCCHLKSYSQVPSRERRESKLFGEALNLCEPSLDEWVTRNPPNRVQQNYLISFVVVRQSRNCVSCTMHMVCRWSTLHMTVFSRFLTAFFSSTKRRSFLCV